MAPIGETQSKVNVVVKSGANTSSSQATFVLTRVSSATFLPRFFAAPATGDAEGALAFVSTDLGPVLLLGGKDERRLYRGARGASRGGAQRARGPGVLPAAGVRVSRRTGRPRWVSWE